MIWMLGGYMWLSIHRPFEVWPILGTLRLERVYMIAMLLVWLIVANKEWLRNRLNLSFLLLTVAIVASWLLSPYPEEGNLTVENWFKMGVFYVLVVSTVRDEKSLKQMIVFYLAAVGLYMLHSLFEFHNGKHVYRMGIPRMIGVDSTRNDPNTFAATLALSLPLVYPAWSLVRSNWHKWLLAGFVALSVLSIILTGSRSGLAGLGFVAFAMAMISQHRMKWLAAMAVLGVLAIPFVPDYLIHRYLTIIDPSYGPQNAQASAEGRVQGFMHGVALWRERPITGIGAGAFMAGSGQNMQAHSLYGQVLGETGTLGAAALLSLLVGYALNFRDARRLVREYPHPSNEFHYRIVLAVSVAVLCLLFLGIAGHNLYRFTWLWYGAFQIAALHCLYNLDDADETESLNEDENAGRDGSSDALGDDEYPSPSPVR